jgi:hypothetical protein
MNKLIRSHRRKSPYIQSINSLGIKKKEQSIVVGNMEKCIFT